MKLFHVVILLFVALLSNGCINEDTEDCLPEETDNFILRFHYETNTQKELFISRIQNVDVFVFKEDGQFVTFRNVDHASLSSFAGITLELEPDNYRIVCWGNITDMTFTSPLDTRSLFGNAFLSNIAIRNSTTAFNGDSLYYALDNISSQDLKITTYAENVIERTINFYNAHIKVEVYVKGLIDKNLQGELLPPIIEMTNVPGGYNFNMQTTTGLVSYLNTSSYQTISGEEVAGLVFYTPRFADSNTIEIRIKKASNSTILTRINLTDFMRENNITVEDIPEAVVPVLVEYKEASVEISVPQWAQTPVDPEL
ncbi:MAG: FimB/Mfa2 family fimbrial subunit [Dysgonomonas sp.]